MSPRAKITVGGNKRRVSFDAIIDTGFDGDLCIPVETAITLGLDLIGRVEAELADGSKGRELVFQGFASFLGKRRPVEILMTDSDDALIGTNLLADCKLLIDFATGQIKITK